MSSVSKIDHVLVWHQRPDGVSNSEPTDAAIEYAYGVFRFIIQGIGNEGQRK